MVPFQPHLSQAGPVPHRTRIMVELYARAYWRHYLLAGIWVLLVTSVWPYR